MEASTMKGISRKEARLLQLLSTGMNDFEVAEQLDLSVVKLEQLRQSVYQKLGVQSPEEAINRARRLQVIN